MSIKQTIANDFKEAFKSKETDKKMVLSMVQSEIRNKEIELGKREEGLNDEEIIAVLARAIKQRKDSFMQYEKGGREELAKKEQKEADILSEYMPKQMNDHEIEKEIKVAIEKIGASGSDDMGKVMGKVMGVLKGKADGAKVREITQRILSK